MKHTVKWWCESPKPVGVEYCSLVSNNEIETIISELINTVRARMVRVYNEAGELVAHYPDANKYRQRAR